MAHGRALRGVELVITRRGLAAPLREAARAPEEIRVVGVERDIQRHGGGDVDQHLVAVRRPVVVPHRAVILAALRRSRVEQAQGRRVRAQGVAAIGNGLALEAPLIDERRGAERLDPERHRRARGHIEVRGLCENDGHGRRVVRHEVKFVEPRAIQSGDDVGIFRVTPAQRNRAGRQIERKFLPVLFAGNLRPLRVADEEFQSVRVGLRGNLPPETNRAGPNHRRLQRRLVRVADEAALRRGLAVVREVGLHEPAVGRGEPLEIGRVHGLGERERRNDFEEHVRADGHARDVADDHRIEAGLLRLRVAQRDRGGVRAEHAGTVHHVRAVTLPLVREREGAGRAHGQGHGPTLRHALRRGLHHDAGWHEHGQHGVRTGDAAHGVRDDHRVNTGGSGLEIGADQSGAGCTGYSATVGERDAIEAPLVGERRAAVRAHAERGALTHDTGPARGLAADGRRRTDDERRQDARDAAEGIAHDHRVIPVLRGGDGGESQVRGGDAAQVAGVDQVRPAAPPLVTERRRAERGDEEIHGGILRRVQARRLRDNDRRGDDGERRNRAGRAAGSVRDHGEIIPCPRLARRGEREVGRRRAADAVAVREERAVEEPLPDQRRGAGGGRGEARAVRRHHGTVRRLNRYQGRGRCGIGHEDKLIHPAAILARRKAAVLHVAPLDDLVAVADGQRAPRPVHFTGDALLRGAVDVEA